MIKRIKLSKWAKEYGITYKTAHKWLKEGNLPAKYEYSPTGSVFVIVDEQTQNINNVYIYSRVSSHDKKNDLNRQIERCKYFCENKGLSVNKIFKEVASGMNDKRREFCKLLEQPIGIIVVEHKDRLTMFGFNYIETLYTKLGGSIIVINNDETEESDLIKDMISVITSFCCRLYGMRRGYTKAKKIKTEIDNQAI